MIDEMPAKPATVGPATAALAEPVQSPSRSSPVGSTQETGSRRRAQRSAAYREEFRRIAPYEGIARLVIDRRQALGLTQQQLAGRVGTSHSVISRIESGQHPTSVTTLRRLAETLWNPPGRRVRRPAR